MNLVRIDPFRDFRAVQRRFDRLVGDAFARSTDADDAPSPASWIPAIDVHENETEITLRAELPGISEEDVELTVDRGRLTVRGEKKLEKEETEGEYRRIESRYGRFYRSFPLPESVDADNIAASFDNGVLTVTLPKSPAAQPQRIEVTTH